MTDPHARLTQKLEAAAETVLLKEECLSTNGGRQAKRTANGAAMASAHGTSRPETNDKLGRALSVYSKWLHMPDLAPVEVVLATIVANLGDGEPVWTMLVGPPGSGKTEIIQSVSGRPKMFAVGTLTEASLLSGSAKRDTAADAKGGLLRQIGDFGYLLLKDFTSVIEINREARGSLLAALREIYDGSWTRHVGVDGGRTLSWKGKLGLLAGCTPTIDTHHAVMSAMGERFLLYRIHPNPEGEHAARALDHIGRESTMRTELAEAASELLSNVSAPPDVQELLKTGTVCRQQIIGLAELIARGRSSVERDSYSRQVTLVPDPEVPTRIVQALARLFGGLIAIGVKEQEALRVLREVGMSCMPAARRAVFDTVAQRHGPIDTLTIAGQLDYPIQTARRALEDLHAHHVLTRVTTGKTDVWNVSEFAWRQYRAAGFSEISPENLGRARIVPEMSDAS